MKMIGTPRSLPLALIASALALGMSAAVAHAVGTTLWQIDTVGQFEQGELDHVVLSSLGEVKLGQSTTRLALDDVAMVWSVVEAPDGSTYLGTGNNGAVLRLRGAKMEEVARTESLVVSALAVGGKGVIFAGTLPGGAIYRLEPAAKGPAKAKVFTTLKRAEHVWALRYDSKRQVLFAGTGPEGIIYVIQASGRAEVYYDSEDDHVLSLALLGPGGDVIAGTSPRARLLRIVGPGRAVALHDFDATEVKGIAMGKGGVIYAAVNTFPDPPSPPKTNSTKSKSSRARPKPGKGTIFRRGPEGNVEPLLEFNEGHLTGVQALDDGLVYAGTGSKGRIVAAGDDRVTYTIADVDERQVLALSLAGRDPLFVTGDVGTVYRLGKAAAGLAEYRTAPLDAGFVSTWGRLDWRGQGTLTVQTRSGSTEEPDQTWSGWSPELPRPGNLIRSPPGRYLQVRVRWARDPGAVLRGLGVYHLANNQRAVITKVKANSPFKVIRPEVRAKAKAATAPPVKASETKSRSETKRTAVLRVSWKVDNPDHDTLRYRLYFREESEPTWRPILPSDTVLTSTRYDWNTSAVPAGHYLVKVDASDELDNPAKRTISSEKQSPPIVIDNQPPRVLGLTAKARQVKGKAVDGFSPIERLEYSLDGLRWHPVFPNDALFDSRTESFSFELPATLVKGSYTVAVRAFDRALNSATGRSVTQIR